jgi:pimeloyl-ACP methyl ester carboxylesterase
MIFIWTFLTVLIPSISSLSAGPIKIPGAKNDIPNKPTIVLCPGFGNAVVDYVNPLGADESWGFRSALERRGFSVRIVPVERWDWIRVAMGLFDPDFWQSNQSPSGWAYGWYLQRTRETVESCCHQNPGESVLLVGHSAGGWLARAALGNDLKNVCGLVTLGTPQLPPPKKEIGCATRGALKNTNEAFPGAFRKDVVYVTVAGNAVTGGIEVSRDVDDIYARRGEGSAQNVAKINYESLIGDFKGVSGDGVVPLSIAHLEGAEQITLDGVLHSINEAGTTLSTDSWYGSEKIVDLWLNKTIDIINSRYANLE